uniref:Uncharacterized protein n=1 Tax=Streptomyces sp. NBC_00003 TaxID=2903608 RepID=A0AAU2UZ99_9ACTN
MTEPISYSQIPVELPLDPWLYAYDKPIDCDVCAALDKQCQEAIRQNQHRVAYGAAEEIRRGHPEHDQQPRLGIEVRAGV